MANTMNPALVLGTAKAVEEAFAEWVLAEDEASRARRLASMENRRLARGPAHAAGFGALHDFLERGFVAFDRMRGADEFLDAVRERETRLLERLYAGEQNPFARNGGTQ